MQVSHTMVRRAVGARSIAVRRYLKRVIETLMRVLPHWYAPVAAPEGSTIENRVSGGSQGFGHLVREQSAWRLAGRGSGRRRTGEAR